MGEKTVCRFCGEQNSYLLQKRLGGRRPFAIAGATPHYAPDRPFQLEHILLNVFVDPKAKTFVGTVTQKLKVIAPGQSRIRLDQVGLKIEDVKLSSRSCEFSIEGNGLHIHLGYVPTVGDSLELSIQYQIHKPQRGIYFTGPDQDYPHKPYQVWTQGQDEDSRHWFPTLDYPNQKATSEVIATVPKGFTAVSNGALISREEKIDGTRFHYRLGTPHVTYLLTLAVAEFAEWSDVGPRGVPVQYFVTPGREDDGKRAFGNTPKMLEVFEKKTGVPYPYEKYSQVAVQDFIFGGMENTSATTQTDLTLHDQRAHLDFSSDPLVSHELAHQWFGDLITCRDWSHAWLNEGFATFMERVWVESSSNPRGGSDEAKYYSYQDLKEYLADDHGRYRRPIVCNTYIEPIDLFDTHLYQKGGLVLNLIRNVLGEDMFWSSVQVYLNRHRGQNVETIDLIRAIEDTTGRNLRRLFDEWVFHAGHPEFEVGYHWHEEKKMTEWVIEQKQTGGAPSITQDGATTLVFHLPVTLEMTLQSGEKITHRIEVGEARERLFLPSTSKPVMVRFDPGFSIPKTLKFPRPKEMLMYQLANDSDCMGRIEAAQELAKVADSEIIYGLGKAILTDSFWGVQAEVAKALAEIRTDLARDQLIQSLVVKHPKARRAVASALGTFRDSKSADALKRAAEKDESYFVEADCTYAWATAKLRPLKPSNAEEANEVEEFLRQQLNKSSYREVIRVAALSGLSDLPGIAQGERPRALQTIIGWTRRGNPQDARGAAVKGLGKILKGSAPVVRTQILEVLSHLADEDNFRLRVSLVPALEESGCVEAIGILSRIRQNDCDGRIRRAAQIASHSLLDSGSTARSGAIRPPIPGSCRPPVPA